MTSRPKSASIMPTPNATEPSGACRPFEDRSDIAGGDAAVSVHAAEAVGRVAGAITGHSRHGWWCKRRPSRYVHCQAGYAAAGVEKGRQERWKQTAHEGRPRSEAMSAGVLCA
jgi:hypothetical protein